MTQFAPTQINLRYRHRSYLCLLDVNWPAQQFRGPRRRTASCCSSCPCPHWPSRRPAWLLSLDAVAARPLLLLFDFIYLRLARQETSCGVSTIYGAVYRFRAVQIFALLINCNFVQIKTHFDWRKLPRKKARHTHNAMLLLPLLGTHSICCLAQTHRSANEKIYRWLIFSDHRSLPKILVFRKKSLKHTNNRVGVLHSLTTLLHT